MNSENTFWQEKPKPNYPPPEKKSGPRLSLKAAMALATGAPGHETLMPLVRKNDEGLRNNDDSKEKVESYLLNLQADIINREELLEQKERRLLAREKDLNKRANILSKKAQEIESRTKEIESQASLQEKAPEAELSDKDSGEAEDELYKETYGILNEREAYIQECENALVQKLTELTRREAVIEQREEQLGYKTKQL